MQIPTLAQTAEYLKDTAEDRHAKIFRPSRERVIKPRSLEEIDAIDDGDAA